MYIIFAVSFVRPMECGTRYAINLNNVTNKNECILIVMHIQDAKIPLIKILYIFFFAYDFIVLVFKAWLNRKFI